MTFSYFLPSGIQYLFSIEKKNHIPKLLGFYNKDMFKILLHNFFIFNKTLGKLII